MSRKRVRQIEQRTL
ncbi:hypothetical protein [Microbispora maris]